MSVSSRYQYPTDGENKQTKKGISWIKGKGEYSRRVKLHDCRRVIDRGSVCIDREVTLTL